MSDKSSNIDELQQPADIQELVNSFDSNWQLLDSSVPPAFEDSFAEGNESSRPNDQNTSKTSSSSTDSPNSVVERSCSKLDKYDQHDSLFYRRVENMLKGFQEKMDLLTENTNAQFAALDARVAQVEKALASLGVGPQN